MSKPSDSQKGPLKQEVYQREYEKLTAIFVDVEPTKRQLVEGLIQDAAFLFSENTELRKSLGETGMVKFHPQHPDIQKPVEAAKQYRQNALAYSTVIKVLNSVLKNTIEPEDGLDEFE
jgi:regulator of replication initiation timing